MALTVKVNDASTIVNLDFTHAVLLVVIQRLLKLARVFVLGKNFNDSATSILGNLLPVRYCKGNVDTGNADDHAPVYQAHAESLYRVATTDLRKYIPESVYYSREVVVNLTR